MLMRTVCHNSSGRWQVATREEHGMQGGWPSAWECQWVSATTQLVTQTLERGDLSEPWTSTGRPRIMSTWACHGQRWSDSVAEPTMKDLEGLQWYHLWTNLSFLSSPAYTWWCKAPWWLFYRISTGTPGMGGEKQLQLPLPTLFSKKSIFISCSKTWF